MIRHPRYFSFISMISLRSGLLLLMLSLVFQVSALGQACTSLGQTPSSAFPVCATTSFSQSTVPLCGSILLTVPGCSNNPGAAYMDRNPYWYKFTCYQSGTLGFLITPNDLNEDYDWQLFDITSQNPDQVFTDPSLVVTGNWSGSFGLTGASAAGVNHISCASIPTDNIPTFAEMPSLIQGHEYILMVSHFSNTQSGYSLSFGGGTAVITDPNAPHLQNAIAGCDGKTVTVKLNKRVLCNSLDGSEFSISPALSTVTSAISQNCSSGFDFNELTITLASPLPTGDYQVIINNGGDGNTLLDNCGLSIPGAEQVPFHFDLPQPTPVDSLGSIGCAPNSIQLYFTKKIDCNSIAADGSDFVVTGPAPVTVSGASGNCLNGLTNVINVTLSSPIYTKGNYTITLKPGFDGTTVIDECGQETLTQMLSFSAVDTVSAAYTTNQRLGCRMDTVTFIHDGANDVNSWNWTFNSNTTATTPQNTMVFPATSTNSIRLIVTNGICSDTVLQTMIFDNEVRAAFGMPAYICPEDPLLVSDSSQGLIDSWIWKFGQIATHNTQSPPSVQFPLNNIETYYNIELVVFNTALNCRDSIRQRLLVFNNCFIAVPSAFTPNGDNLNDYLSPHNAIKADQLEFKIFNRWGQLVFKTANWMERWNGTIGGLPQPAGVYVWFLNYTIRGTGQKIFQKGTTMLIR